MSDFGELGPVGTELYYYAIYCLMPSEAADGETCGGDAFSARYQRARGVAIFASDSTRMFARLVLERADPEIGRVSYATPQLLQNNSAILLHLPIVLDGTSRGNESEYFLRAADRWEAVESRAWQVDLQSRLPAGLAIRTGIWPDRRLQAEAPLYRADDANCCPTGGRATLRLSIHARRFVLDALSITGAPQLQ